MFRPTAIIICSLTLALICAGVHAEQQHKNAGHSKSQWSDETGLQALGALHPIDTHTHVMIKGDFAFYAMLDRLHMHILDILLVDPHFDYRKNLQSQLDDAWVLIHDSHGHASLCTSFDPFKFNNPDFAASAIKALNRDFSEGAIAVKIWKNIGMELKDKNGNYVEADDPKFERIYQDIQKHNRTLIAHLAEPDEAWQALNPKGLDYSYYKENPVWYMYGKPGVPSKKQILDARDHLLAMNPKLRVVGAHLGSMEDDLDGLGQRFDKYPNFATDVAARVVHLVVMPREKVRAFILKYQDRLTYGTDMEVGKDEPIEDAINEWQGQYVRDWHYFSTGDTFDYDGHKTQGLTLPPAVLRKLYHDNAVHWFPGIVSANQAAATSQ